MREKREGAAEGAVGGKHAKSLNCAASRSKHAFREEPWNWLVFDSNSDVDFIEVTMQHVTEGEAVLIEAKGQYPSRALEL